MSNRIQKRASVTYIRHDLTERIRHVAEKLRQMAKEDASKTFADQFLDLARQYECLAERAERDPIG
jgi:hypothetical protein